MTTPIPAVANNKANITTAEYVKLTIYNEYGNLANNNVYTFSSSYTSDTIDGVEYSPLGGLLAVGQQNRSLRVTNGDTSVQISGIGGNNIYAVLESQGKIRGSKIEVTRGFFNPNTMVLANAVVRFTGIVTNYSIQEDREGLEDNFTVTLDASSFKTILENRIAGRKTNKNSWQFFDATDSAMNNINSLAGFTFDFGSDPKSKTVVPGYNGGGIPGGGGGMTKPGDTTNQNRK